MGKNQQHKDRQRTRGTGGEGGDDIDTGDGTVDVTFHTPEWHAARLAALTTERVSWEDWKAQQKKEGALAAAAAEDEDRQNREYRAQLDADRAARLAGSASAHVKLKDAGVGKAKKASSEKRSKKSKSKREGKHKKSKRSSEQQRGSSTDSSEDKGKRRKRRKALPALAEGPVKLSDFMRE